jgi:hypothetical protein
VPGASDGEPWGARRPPARCSSEPGRGGSTLGRSGEYRFAELFHVDIPVPLHVPDHEVPYHFARGRRGPPPLRGPRQRTTGFRPALLPISTPAPPGAPALAAPVPFRARLREPCGLLGPSEDMSVRNQGYGLAVGRREPSARPPGVCQRLNRDRAVSGAVVSSALASPLSALAYVQLYLGVAAVLFAAAAAVAVVVLLRMRRGRRGEA